MVTTLITLISGLVGGAVLNRLRGMKSYLVWVAAAALLAGAWWYQMPWIGIALLVAAYVGGESWGWTKWINCIPGNFTQAQYNEQWAYPKEVDTPGYEKLLVKVIDDRQDYKKYVFTGMVLRGALWWAPTFTVLWYFGTPVWYAVGAAAALSFVFPVVYKWAYKNQFMGAYLKTAEVIYGAVYGLALAGALLLR